MCGIYAGIDIYVSQVINELKLLEYRGYDEWGIGTVRGPNSYTVYHPAGPIRQSAINEQVFPRIVLGHTRWATHKKNKPHPVVDCQQKVMVVHNGTVDNLNEISPFETHDTTYIANRLSELIYAPVDIMKEIHGDNAIVFVDLDRVELNCMRRGTPLYITKKGVVTSDIITIDDDEEYCLIEEEKCYWFSKNNWMGGKTEWQKKVVGEEGQSAGGDMLFEIKEQPQIIEKIVQDGQYLLLYDVELPLIAFGCGSSYNACLFGQFADNSDIDIIAQYASSFGGLSVDNFHFLAVSQSGETKDVLSVVKKLGYVLGLTKKNSTIFNNCAYSIELPYGIEQAVVATKSFTAQCAWFQHNFSATGISADDIKQIKYATELDIKAKQLVNVLRCYSNIFVLGENIFYPIALEIALKLKEACYIHAEGMISSEIKHGPLAVIDDQVLSIFIVNNINRDIQNNIAQVKTRDGKCIEITREYLGIPNWTSNFAYAMCVTIFFQLVSYYLAKAKNINPNRPRNLAKSVTV